MRIAPEEKCWGRARHVFANPHAAVSILETYKGYRCSRHFHTERINRFIVQYGSIDVVEYDPSGTQEISRIRLNPGDVHDVEAGVVHSFEVTEPGLVIEVYYPSRPTDRVSHEDITRLDEGGRVSAAA